MATGRLGANDLTAATYTARDTVPATTFSVVTLSICNRGNGPCTVRVAITTTSPPSTPNAGEFIEFDAEIGGKGVLERTGIVLDAGKIISVYSNAANVSAVAWGIETPTT